MKNIAFLLLIICTCCGLNATPASPLQYMISPFGSSYVFVMNESKDGEVSSGICYHLNDDGGFVRAWEVHGFYAWPEDVLLSQDGVFLVRFKKLHQGQIGEDTNFIEIYRNGVLSVKKPIGEFMNPEKLKYCPFGLCHAEVLGDSAELVDARTLENIGIISDSNMHNDPWFLKFRTRENVCYAVGVISGKVLSRIEKEKPKEKDALMPWEVNPK